MAHFFGGLAEDSSYWGVTHPASDARAGPSVFLIVRNKSIGWPIIGWEGFWFGILTVWLIVQSAFIASVPAEALGAFWSEWSKLSLMLLLGILISLYGGHSKGRADWPIVGAFLGYFVHVIATLGYQAWSYLTLGTLMRGQSLLGDYGYVSPYVTGALALLLAEVVARLRGSGWLPFSNLLLILAIAATLAAQVSLDSKSGVVTALILFIGAVTVMAKVPGRNRWFVLFLGGGLAIAVASFAISTRWEGAAKAIVSVLNTPNDYQTLTGSNDPLARVNQLDNSFYARAVWIKIGLEGVMRHPLGLGYGANAFGRYVMDQGGPSGAVSSHSGWIDFALANGIPGLVLMLLLLLSVLKRGWKAFREGNPAGLPTVFFTGQYLFRSSFFDDLLGQSRLTGFFLVGGILWALAALPSSPKDPLLPRPH